MKYRYKHNIAAFIALTSLFVCSAPAFSLPQVDCPSVESIRAVKFDQSYSYPWTNWILAIKNNAFNTYQKWYFYLYLNHTFSDSAARVKALDYMPDLIFQSGPVSGSSGNFMCMYGIRKSDGGIDTIGYAVNPPELSPVKPLSTT